MSTEKPQVRLDLAYRCNMHNIPAITKGKGQGQNTKKGESTEKMDQEKVAEQIYRAWKIKQMFLDKKEN